MCNIVRVQFNYHCRSVTGVAELPGLLVGILHVRRRGGLYRLSAFAAEVTTGAKPPFASRSDGGGGGGGRGGEGVN